MDNLAAVLRRHGKYEAAGEIYQQALELSKKVLGPEHQNTLMSMNNLAAVLRRQGKYEAAEEIDRRALELSKKILGPEHPDTVGRGSRGRTTLVRR
jgi:tetratricopeptide (TPR) repeat protein